MKRIDWNKLDAAERKAALADLLRTFDGLQGKA